MSLAAGTKLGPYEILALIGAGVWSARIPFASQFAVTRLRCRGRALKMMKCSRQSLRLEPIRRST